MEIKLNEFEQFIDPKIVKRGLVYFNDDKIIAFEEDGPDEYLALVDGSDNEYEVSLKTKSGLLVDWECDCPYDDGPVCKHVVACLYYMRENDLTIELPVENPKETKSQPKPKSKTDQIEELLTKLSHDELKKVIYEQCQNDRSFRDMFIARYSDLTESASKELYVKQIREVMNSHADRSGFIDYYSISEATGEIDQLEGLAEKMINKGEYRIAMYMAQALLEEMVAALQYVDDSGGDVGGLIEQAMDLLHQIIRENRDEPLRKELFTYALDAFEKKLFDGWDWHLGMINLAIELQTTQEEYDRIDQILQSVKPNGESWDWNFEQATKLRLQLLKKKGIQSDVEAFMQAHINMSDFRTEIINNLIAGKDYEKALKIAEDGIQYDEKEKPGLVTQWREMQLEIYEKCKNRDKIIELARYQFLNKGRRPGKEYFALMKKLVETSEWNSFVDRLIVDAKKRRWIEFYQISEVFITEKRWEELFNFLSENITFYHLEHVEKYLLPRYVNELATYYTTLIHNELKHATSRDHYRQMAGYLKRVVNMGKRDVTDAVIDSLKKQYSNRRAMIEELSKV
ncbi:SWIM zinc finger domain-containing protein [Parabacteroides sp. FAFU027]|uniref:SWIM zinc finger family protein n=1 Tax=Parabacteroides sp. FAFU027 TaxID=2922715 RepID=UPI001FAF9072|nr:SWIM zinc finger family protein [Parabacteroides sp. FAFU027]